MSKLYLITNRKLVKNHNFFHVISESIKGGVDTIILREKDLNEQELISYGKKIKEVIGYRKVKLMINGNLSVVKAVKADGYHMKFKDFLDKKPKNISVGVSVHSVEEAMICEEKGADYILVSHIYPTDCKKGLQPKGVNFIKEVRSKVSMPIIALGGINPENAREAIENGADGVAVMSYIMASEEPFISAKKLKENIKIVTG
ncbi:thiamine phosphate synthase [Haloimpatiens lingqiaonensis]|uniref:thiamine phosphate synthase n=1 Tax=Haloimpatiens lingqiaonensis TaxID=1380675 RepID=UPI0010FD5A4D|nr:thiamine phosphate synthase [Haloimpatiens lingqiaonensis]